jgi:putative membrane protein
MFHEYSKQQGALMHLAAQIVTALVAVIHIYIVLLETVLFNSRGRRTFGLSKETAEIVQPAMSNQGCYNGFLVAALVVGLVHPDAAIASAFNVFGLACVAVAGIWGGVTVKRTILLIQTLPAVIGLALHFGA